MTKTNSETADRELGIEAILNAPIEMVWKMWTEPDHIAQWWGPNGFTNTIHKMDMVENGEWLLTMHGPDGKDYPNKSNFKEVVKYEKIVYQHYKPNFLATVIFEPLDKKTLIKWTSLFETKTMFENVVKTFKADEGMKQNIEKLQNYLLLHS